MILSPASCFRASAKLLVAEGILSQADVDVFPDSVTCCSHFCAGPINPKPERAGVEMLCKSVLCLKAVAENQSKKCTV